MDKEQLFSIGEVARLFHMSVSSLRHYESLGLLSPEYINPDSGYRYYSTRQFEVLNTLRYLRALDMLLPEIADFLQNRDVETIEQKLRQQKAVVEQKLAELSRIERKIDHTCRKSLAQQSVGGCSQAGRNCHPQRAGASGYGDQNGKSCKGSRKESPAGNRGSGRKAGRSDWCRRCGGSFRCRGDLACRDVVCFAARYPVRR